MGSQPEIRPTFTWGSKNCAFSEPMMMSVSHRKCSPPPQQIPLTAQMMGLCSCSISRAIGSHTWPIGRVLRLLHVDAGAEELLPRRREDRDPRVVVIPEVGPDRLHLVAHLHVERVARVLPVQRDVRDPVPLLVDRLDEGQIRRGSRSVSSVLLVAMLRSDRREAAVDVDRLHRDRAGTVRAQEQHERHDLLGIDEPARAGSCRSRTRGSPRASCRRRGRTSACCPRPCR